MRIRTLALSIAVVLPGTASSSSAQVHLDWQHRLNLSPTGFDLFNDARVAPSGAVYAVGETGATGSGDLHDVLLAKVDAGGSLAWVRTFDYAGGYMDYGTSLVLEPGTESVYVIGRGDAQSTLGLAQKYDSAGTLLWTSTYAASSGSALFYAACLTPAGNLAAIAGLGQGGFAVVEYDPQGNELWRNEEPLGYDYPGGIASDSNGDILICGPYYAVGGNSFMGVTRFDSHGTYLWRQLIGGGGTGYQSAVSLIVDGAGSTYVCGRLVTQPNSVSEALVKLDASGNILWTRLHKGSQTDPTIAIEVLETLSIAANGNIRASGACTNIGSGRDLQVLEYTPAGQLVWESTWDGPAHLNDYCTGAHIEPDGSQVLFAFTDTGGAAYQTAIVRWDAHGNPVGSDLIDVSLLGPGVPFGGVFGPDGRRIFFGRTPSGADSDAVVLEVREQSVSYCFGDGSDGNCPCANTSPLGEGRGCAHSQGGSARLTSTGLASLAGDSLLLTSAGQLPATSSIFLQGGGVGAPAHFGDGILCLAAPLHRMFVHAASGGSVIAPSGSDSTISARSAALGDPIAAGARRSYQVLYRDPAAGFCSPPSGSNFNLSSALSVTWVP